MVAAAVGCTVGVLSGMGIGGGTLLVLYLTLVAGLPQGEAARANLLYFLCCAPPALWRHHKAGMLCGQAVRWCVAAGVPAAIATSLLALGTEDGLLRRLFGVLMLVVGVRELLTKRKSREQRTDSAAE